MDVQVGDIVTMRKAHPCGCADFTVLRVGMDFRVRCRQCGHEIMLPRVKAERMIKKLDRSESTPH